MSILCLARTVKFDYAGWFADASTDLLAISSVNLPLQDRYRLVKRVDDLDADAVVESTAIELARTEPISHLVAHSEYDLLRAAHLREYLGLPGQHAESALAYRDKVVMKEYMTRAGIPVAAFRRQRSPVDLYAFADAHGYPIVVKPVDSCGSHDVRVVRDREALVRTAASNPAGPRIIESYVEGAMYHVNGLVRANGERFFAPCAYINGALDYQVGGLFGTRTIDPNTPFSQRLTAFTQRVISALPEADPLAFHAEIFHTPDDQLLLCEIAARTPGSLTIELIERGYGINLHRAWARAQAGLAPDAVPLATPETLAASLRVPIRRSRLAQLPAVVPFPWISTICLTGRVGHLYEPATTYTDDVLSAIAVGRSDGQLLDRIAEFSDWLERHVRWET